MNNATTLRTIPEIARDSGYQHYQVRRIVETRGIKATYRLGVQGAQLFNAAGERRILAELGRSARRPPETPHAQSTTDNRDQAKAAAPA